MITYVIDWQWTPGVHCYVTPRSPNSAPYTNNPAAAKQYLAWLDAGNVGTHMHVPKEKIDG